MNQSEATVVGINYITSLLDSGHTVLIQDGGLAARGRNRTPTAIGTVLGDLSTLDQDGRAVQTVRIDD